MSSNILGTNRTPIIDVTVDPGAIPASTVNGAWLDAKDFANYVASLFVGTLGASATVDAKIEQATDSGGSGAKDVAGKAITQLTDGGSDSNKQVEINLRADELDIENDFNFFRFAVTVGTATSDLSAHVRGFDARYEPEDDVATVDEIV